MATTANSTGYGPRRAYYTGATSHIVNDRSKFISFDKAFDPSAHVIELADGSKAKVVSGKGVAKVKLHDVNGNARDLILNNALYVPSYKQDIFSVNAAVEEGESISLDQRNKRFKSSDGTAFNIEQVGRLFQNHPQRYEKLDSY